MTKVPADVFDSLVHPLKQEIANCIGKTVGETFNHLCHVIDRLERADDEQACKAEAEDSPPAYDACTHALHVRKSTLIDLRDELQQHLDTLISSVPKAHSVYQMGRIAGRIQAIEEMIVDIGRDIEGVPK